MVTEILTFEEMKEIDKKKNLLGLPDFDQIDYYLAKHWEQYGIGLYLEIRKIQKLEEIREKIETLTIIQEEKN